MVDIDGQVVIRAAGQDGLVRRSDLRDMGVSAKVVRRLCRIGLLRPISPEVLALGGVPMTPARHEQAALWQAGSLAVLSHASAAVRWGFARIRPGVVEVTVPYGTAKPRQFVGRLHVSRRFDEGDVTERGGCRLTSPERTLIDLAARLGRHHLTESLTDLCRRDVIDLATFAARLGVDRRRRVHGLLKVDDVVAWLLPLPAGESWLEDEFIDLLARAGRRLPATQVWVTVDGRRYRVDNLWARERLIVELDGHQFHSTRPDRAADAERRARLTAAGYDVVVFTFEHVVERPTYVLATVDAHLACAAAA